MRILGLDTATEACSAALWVDGAILLREVVTERGHAGLILRMIDELLAEGGASLKTLDAIAFGRGPGSFTGVRLAASVTQGLAFGAGLPVVAVSDLRAVAQRALAQPMDNSLATRRLLVCNDARMHEVYWACFELESDELVMPAGLEHVDKPADVDLPDSWSQTPVHGAGRGFAAYPELRARMAGRLGKIDDELLPRASEIAVLAAPEVRAGRVIAAEQAFPVYLRDNVARPK